MAPVTPKKRHNTLSALAKLEKEILGPKKNPSPRRRPKETWFNFKGVVPARTTERRPINRAKMILDAALENPTKYCVDGRLPARSDPLLLSDVKPDMTREEKVTPGKSRVKPCPDKDLQEYLRRKKFCLERSNKLQTHFSKRGFHMKPYYWQDISFDSAEFEPPRDKQMYEEFPPLLAKDPFELPLADGMSMQPLSPFRDGSMVHIERLKDEQLSLNNWLKKHPLITKYIRKQQVDLLMTISRQFNNGHNLGFHAVCLLDHFMSKPTSGVVTPENIRFVAIGAFVASAVSRLGRDVNAMYRFLLSFGYTQIPEIKRFTQRIQSTLGINGLEVPTALDFLDAHCKKWVILRPHQDPSLLFSMDQVGIESQRLLVEATSSYSVMTQTYASRLATAAILVACERLREDVGQLFPELRISKSADEVRDINITMKWLRQQDMAFHNIKGKPLQ